MWFHCNFIKPNSYKIINNIVTTFKFNFKNDFHVRKKKKIVGKYVLKCYYVPKCIYTYKHLPISTWNWIFIDWTENDDNVSGSATTGIMHLDIIMALLVRLRGSRNILSHPQSGRHLRPIFAKKPFPGTLFGVSVFPISAHGTACTHYTEFMPTVFIPIFTYR